MSLSLKMRVFEKTRLIKPGDICLPTINLNDFTLPDMSLNQADIDYVLEDCRVLAKPSQEKIHPFGVPFGISQKVLASLVRKPAIIINNQQNIPNHEIHLIRRKLGNIIIASQFHFIKNKLFLVIDEFNSGRNQIKQALKKSLNGYFQLLPDLGDKNSEDQVLSDIDGNLLCVKNQNNLLIRYCSSIIWDQAQ